MCPHIEFLVDISQSLDSESSSQCIENKRIARTPQGPMVDGSADANRHGERVLTLHDNREGAVCRTVVEEAVELLALGRFLICQINLVDHEEVP